MKIIYARESLENIEGPSIMLCGPTPRSPIVQSWRPEAIRIFQDLEWPGTLLSPEDKEGFIKEPVYAEQVEWEHHAMNRATCIMFWVARSFPDMMGLTTNIEWGMWGAHIKTVLGAPLMADKVKYMFYWADKMKRFSSRDLTETIKYSISLTDDLYYGD
jgi:hypothetical protein